MSRVEVGKRVPSFTLQGTDGAWSLQNAGGNAVVLYFYPRDDTSGCTQEGRDFAALHALYAQAKVLLFGISPDSVASHEKFKRKLALPFALLSDPDHQVCTLFEVYKEKSMYGRKYLGVERSTFLLDAAGVLRHEWRKVKVNGHAEAVLAAVRTL